MHHTQEPTVFVQGEHAARATEFGTFPPAVPVVALAHCLRLAGSDGAKTSEDCHPRTTWWPLTCSTSSPALPPCVSPEVFTGRNHGRTSIRPCRQKLTAHTHRFRTLASPPPPVADLPWGHYPSGHPSPSTRNFRFSRSQSYRGATSVSRVVQSEVGRMFHTLAIKFL